MVEKLREIKDAARYVPVGDGFFDPYGSNIEAVDAAVDRALSALQPQDAPAKGDAGDDVIQADRKSVVSGKRVSVRVDLGVRGLIKKNTCIYITYTNISKQTI